MLISGKEVSSTIKSKLKEAIEQQYVVNDISLVIIRVGNDPASIKYTNNKVKAAKECGILPFLVEMPEDTSQEDLDKTFKEFIISDDVHGIIVQLPLPKHLNLDYIEKMFNEYPEKDVDGFSLKNTGILHLNKNYATNFNIPCTAKGCIDMIQSVNYDVSGKIALVIGRSNIVGRPVARLLEQLNATVIQVHSRTKREDFKELAKLAKIVVVAIGKQHAYKTSEFPNAEMFIDVGINVNEEGKMVGDLLDDANIRESENKYITPVPGGVGPMTVANLLYNTYNSYERGKNK